IEGQRAARSLRGRSISATSDREYERVQRLDRRSRLLLRGTAAALVILVAVQTFLVWHIRRSRPLRRVEFYPWFFSSLVVLVVIVATYFITSSDPSPPFGF